MVPADKVDGLRITKLHAWSARILSPLVFGLSYLRIDANWFTAASLLFAVAAGISLGVGWWWWAIIAIAMNGLLDMIDGQLARSTSNREHHLKKLGVYLDPFLDRVADIIIFAGLQTYVILHFVCPNADQPLIIAYFLLVLVTSPLHITSSWIRAKLESINEKLSEGKPLTRAGFHIQLVLLCFIEGCWTIILAGFPIIFWGMLAICLVTIGNFLRRAIMSIKLFFRQARP